MHKRETAPPANGETAKSFHRLPTTVYPNRKIDGWTRSQMTEANRNSDGTFSGWCEGCNRQTVIISHDGRPLRRECTDCARKRGLPK